MLSTSKHSGSILKSKLRQPQRLFSQRLMYCFPSIVSGNSILLSSLQIRLPFSTTALKNFTFSIGHFVLKGIGTFISTGESRLQGVIPLLQMISTDERIS